jgi:transposase
VGKTRRGPATKLMAIADRSGLPISATIAPGQRNEVLLVDDAVRHRFTAQTPQRLIGDRAYDSAKLQTQLEGQGIELIAPKRSNSPVRRQDGRALRRYKRRWKVERLFAWLLRSRRVATRYEYKAENYLGFVHIGCLVILLKHL